LYIPATSSCRPAPSQIAPKFPDFNPIAACCALVLFHSFQRRCHVFFFDHLFHQSVLSFVRTFRHSCRRETRCSLCFRRIHRLRPRVALSRGFLLSSLLCRSHSFLPSFHVRPFLQRSTMASADSCWLSCIFQYGLPVPWHPQQASPGKSIIFLSTYPPHLLLAAFGSMDFALICELIQLPQASYEVRVPRARGLP